MTLRSSECIVWSPAQRLTRDDVKLGPTTRHPVLDIVGRWSELVLTLRFPTAWTTGAHLLTVRSKNRGASPAVLVVDLDTVDWQTIDGSKKEGVVSVANRPGDGFAVELQQVGALTVDELALVGTLVAEARPPEGLSYLVAERADQPVTPRALPQYQAALLGWHAASSKFLPLAVSAAGVLDSGAAAAIDNAGKFVEVAKTGNPLTLEAGRDATGKQKVNVLTGTLGVANLPSAATYAGQSCVIALEVATAVTVTRDGTDTIDGATTRIMADQWEKLTLVANDAGTGWRAFPGAL